MQRIGIGTNRNSYEENNISQWRMNNVTLYVVRAPQWASRVKHLSNASISGELPSACFTFFLKASATELGDGLARLIARSADCMILPEYVHCVLEFRSGTCTIVL